MWGKMGAFLLASFGIFIFYIIYLYLQGKKYLYRLYPDSLLFCM